MTKWYRYPSVLVSVRNIFSAIYIWIIFLSAITLKVFQTKVLSKLRFSDRYLINSMSKSIVDVIKHINFQLYRWYLTSVIWKSKCQQMYKQTSSKFDVCFQKLRVKKKNILNVLWLTTSIFLIKRMHSPFELTLRKSDESNVWF